MNTKQKVVCINDDWVHMPSCPPRLPDPKKGEVFTPIGFGQLGYQPIIYLEERPNHFYYAPNFVPLLEQKSNATIEDFVTEKVAHSLISVN
jgi:hypothetical protein